MLCRRALMPRDPAGDLGPGVEAELVQDAADVALDGALGDEEARADLLAARWRSVTAHDVRWREQAAALGAMRSSRFGEATAAAGTLV